MESSLQSNRQGRPRRGSEHHVPPHSIILVRCIVYVILHMLTFTMACTSCLYYKLTSTTSEGNNRNHACPAWGGPCGGCPGCLAFSAGLGAGPDQTQPTASNIGRPPRPNGLGASRPETGRRRLSAAAGGQSCRPALLSRHHDISLRRGQRPRHRRKQPSQDRA